MEYFQWKYIYATENIDITDYVQYSPSLGEIEK